MSIPSRTSTSCLFAELFVKSGQFEVELYRGARDIEEARLRGDYEAASFDAQDASDALRTVERFIEAVGATVEG